MYRKKFITGFLLLTLVLSFTPSKAGAIDKIPAIPVSDSALRDKEAGLTVFGYTIPGLTWDSIAILAAKKMIEKITDSTVKWINSGFDGNPAYVTDPRQYFTDIADGVAGEFISASTSPIAFLCSPFQANIKLSLVQEYHQPDRFQCTLTEVVGNIENFYDDFSQGGWDAWFSMTQNSSNNPYGAYLTAKIEMDSRIANAIGLKDKDLDRGRGFLSWTECAKKNPAPYIIGESGIPVLNPEYVPGKAEGECVKDGPIQTPGSTIESGLSNVLGTGIRRLELADEFDEIIGALIDQLLEKTIFNSKGGLKKAPKVSTTAPGTPPTRPAPIDIDGDGIPDGTDTDGDGEPDICLFGGADGTTIGPPCAGSTQVKGPPPGWGGGGGQCSASGNQYEGDLRSAIDAVLSANPGGIADKPNLEDANGFKANGKEFMILVAQELNVSGFSATAEVLNGNSNPNKGEDIALWQGQDAQMERYATLAGGGTNPSTAKTIAQSIAIEFTGFVPLGCTPSGGSKDCGCKDDGGGTPTDPTDPTPIGTNPPLITSVSPSSVTAGQTVLIITGTNLTSKIQFFDSSGGRYTTIGNANATKTQTTVTVPADLPTGKAMVKVYKDASTISNGWSIQVGGSGGGQATATSTNATGGWGGSVAYNPALNNWLVVSGGVNGRIMGNDGTPVTPEFTINSSTAYGKAKVAYASDVQKYLVIWIGFPDSVGGTIYGRFVNPDGSMSGGQFVIFKDPAGGFSYIHENGMLQYDSANQKFVFVWEYRHPKVDSNLMTISNTGALGPVIDVGEDASGESWSPSVAINEAGNEYCIAYDKRNDGKVAMRKYSPATGTLGAESTIAPVGTDMSIAYNSTDNKYLVGWSSVANTTSQGRILNSCNITNGGATFTLNSAGGTVSVAYNPRFNTYASIVQNQNDTGNTYNVLNASGVKIKSGIAFTGGNGNFYPIVAANSTDGTFAAISSKDYATTRFAPGIK